MSAVLTRPLPTWQSNITRVKQTIIIYKHNTPKDCNNYVYIIAHLYGSELYNHEKVNFTCKGQLKVGHTA